MAWLSGYARRYPITFSPGSALAEPVAGAPVCVRPGDLTGLVQADCDDAVFTGTDGTTLLTWYWESKVLTAAVAHVKVDLPAGSTPTLLGYLYSGNASATDQSNEAGTFDNGFAARYAMSEATDATVYDSTANNNDGTPTGSPVGGATGAIGRGIQFDGTGDKIDCGTGASTRIALPLSLSCWCNTATADDTGYLIDNANGGLRGYSLAWQQSSYGTLENDRIQFKYGNGAAFVTVSSSAVFSDYEALVHVAATVGADGALAFYRNGVAAGTATITGYNHASTQQLCLGNRTGGASAATRFAGIIDEARVHSTNRTASWMLVEYLSGAGTLLTVGAAEFLPSGRRRFNPNVSPGTNPGWM